MPGSPAFRLPPVAAWTSALIATLVGFGGTVPLVVQAMGALGASPEQVSSAVTALCLGMAIPGAILSIWLRVPVVLAWSTPGAALLATAVGVSWPVAIGAFVVAAVLTILLGLVPLLGRWAERIPPTIASAMLAGVLLPFCLGLFRLGGIDPLLVGLLLAVYIVARRTVPLYALLLVLAAGMGFSVLRGDLGELQAGPAFGVLLPTMPQFDLATMISLGVPLFLVTLVSQNLPGLVVLRNAGYTPKPAPLLMGVGIASLMAAPFGAHALNLAAITAALCMGPEAHPDASKRWTVAVIYAGFYLILALFAPVVVQLFLALPSQVIASLAGVALIPALTGAMTTMLSGREKGDPVILTFLGAASGLTLFGLGSAFWGLVAGFAALGVARLLRREAAANRAPVP